MSRNVLHSHVKYFDQQLRPAPELAHREAVHEVLQQGLAVRQRLVPRDDSQVTGWALAAMLETGMEERRAGRWRRGVDGVEETGRAVAATMESEMENRAERWR